MIMSNFIDEAERHAELYNAFTPRQRSILNIVEDPGHVSDNDKQRQNSLRAFKVSQAEIHWLERTGRILPGNEWNDQAIKPVARDVAGTAIDFPVVNTGSIVSLVSRLG